MIPSSNSFFRNELQKFCDSGQTLKERWFRERLESVEPRTSKVRAVCWSFMDADRDALARYLDGDERAFEELVVRYEAKVRQVANGVLRDPALAEDIAQETFLTAYRKAGSFRGDGSVRSWLMRIAVRRALDELRKRGRKAEVVLEETGGPTSEPHGGLEAGWDIARGLAGLTPEHRTALMLKEVDGMSYREIADVMDWPMGTVATRIHRARLELRARLRETEHAVSEK